MPRVLRLSLHRTPDGRERPVQRNDVLVPRAGYGRVWKFVRVAGVADEPLLERDPEAGRTAAEIRRVDVLAARAEVVLDVVRRAGPGHLDRVSRRVADRGDPPQVDPEDRVEYEHRARHRRQRRDDGHQARALELPLQHDQAPHLAAHERVRQRDGHGRVAAQDVVQVAQSIALVPAAAPGEQAAGERCQLRVGLRVLLGGFGSDGRGLLARTAAPDREDEGRVGGEGQVDGAGGCVRHAAGVPDTRRAAERTAAATSPPNRVPSVGRAAVLGYAPGMIRRALPFALLSLLACPRSGDETSGLSTMPVTSVTTPGSTGGSGSTSGSSSTSTGAEDSSAAGGSASASGSASTGGFPDAGMMPDGGPPPPPGCKGKIDILLSISSQANMFDEQEQIKASFPGFVATIQQEFADFDHHIMVAGARGKIFACDGCKDVCPDGPPDYPCGVPLDACDDKLGAGITLPRGWNASNERCELYGGRRYIMKGEPDLPGAFTCIASVGTSGHNAVVREVMHALTPDNLALQGCNGQFLRKDALLVIVVIIDKDDTSSDNYPPDWTQAVLDAKGGDGEAVVLLVVAPDNEDPKGVCKPFVPYDSRLREWVGLMPHALYRSICVPDYAPHFAEAVDLIKQQCEVFIPQ